MPLHLRIRSTTTLSAEKQAAKLFTQIMSGALRQSRLLLWRNSVPDTDSFHTRTRCGNESDKSCRKTPLQKTLPNAVPRCNIGRTNSPPIRQLSGSLKRFPARSCIMTSAVPACGHWGSTHAQGKIFSTPRPDFFRRHWQSILAARFFAANAIRHSSTVDQEMAETYEVPLPAVYAFLHYAGP